ncbi:hypothetical protein NHB29_22500 (plasmid) [Pantoea agglomerans]|uniref:hypothetical protein n=1 Tax=Enterobacter agglomerans TaxID=549 RepID=UPI00273A606A|nr:hypothetical protein [Pantoea agglomerans]WLO87191.1 hypothetical protein NHB29_22500 [Pantoea agglomerans]
MQITRTKCQDPEEIYWIIGEAVLMLDDNSLGKKRLRIAEFLREELAKTGEWSPGIRLGMQNVTDMLKFLTAWDKVESHCDAEARVL